MVKSHFESIMKVFYYQQNTLFILDPPYLCTEAGTYKQDRYFDLVDFLTLFKLVRPPFLFFSSTKSEILRVIEFFNKQKEFNYQSFENYKRIHFKTGINKNSVYEDNLIFKF